MKKTLVTLLTMALMMSVFVTSVYAAIDRPFNTSTIKVYENLRDAPYEIGYCEEDWYGDVWCGTIQRKSWDLRDGQYYVTYSGLLNEHYICIHGGPWVK
ncbi:hypothetical protein VQL36_08980 [Chengkuizengella sp. SCS-71B]|uniref:hypothetical protein n=1 Tax=Chengkuizengella sp. SCS-71B TaxID=3115290 RepID=UPI0032C21DEB